MQADPTPEKAPGPEHNLQVPDIRNHQDLQELEDRM